MPSNIAGYDIGEKIQGTPLVSLFRATRQRDGKTVTAKTLNAEHPSNRHVAAIRREYQIAQKLRGVDGVMEVLGLETYGNGNLAIISQAFGLSLAQLIKERADNALPLNRFLNIAIQLAKTVGALHQHNVVHKNINPRNIVIDPVTDDVRLMNFAIASELSLERQDINASRILEGSLPYISPEQTGRMNRDLDYRSDYYSLGVTFYELLTRQLPYDAGSALEWVHCHISRVPRPPVEVNPNVPAPLSDIVLKLMSKSAEDRYQSAYGLVRDLEECQRQLINDGRIEAFRLGLRDISEKFLIPQTLYGREDELATLQEIFADVAEGGAKICLIQGYSGVGKSALANEISNTIVRSNGQFIQGKFDQLQRNTPYAVISMAIRSWIDQQLAESKDRLDAWRSRLTASMGTNARILQDLVPELVQIIGEQPPVPELPPTEAQNRFQIVFQKFVNVLARAEHPLVMFLDDLQWCDAPTLSLLQKLMTARDTGHFFLIAAYRSNEVDAGHPLLLMRDEISKVRQVDELPLVPLDQATVERIVADTLRSEPDNVAALAELLFQKTEGNPFFVNELFRSLHEDGYITFNSSAGGWAWRMDDIRQAEISDSVVDFMIGNLRKLPGETQKILLLASCIGNRFDLRTLSIISESPMEETSASLLEALRRSMIIPLDDGYKYVGKSDPGMDDKMSGEENMKTTNPSYKFQHDRVQQAAHALIDTERKQRVHLSIGRLLQRITDKDDQEARLIDIVSHLNEGRHLIATANEKDELAQLNLRAAVKAHQASAYQAALQYLEIGLSQLSPESWEHQYTLVRALSLQYIQCAYLTGRHDDAERQIDTTLARVKTPLEKAEVLSIRTRQFATMGKMEGSIEAAIEGLNLLGVEISAKPSQAMLKAERARIDVNLGGRDIADLIHAPKIADPVQAMAIRLLMEIFPAAFLSGSGNLFQFLVLKSVNLSIEYGNSPEAAFAYAGYGMLLCGALGNPRKGQEYGRLALAMNEQFDDITLKSRIIYVYGMFIHHWNNHWSSMTEWFRKGIETGYQSGDLLYLAYSAQDCIIWDPKINLETASREQRKYLAIVKDCEYQDSLDSGTLFLQMQLNFQGLTDDWYSLNDATFDERQCYEGMLQRKFMTGVANYHIYKTEIAYFYGDLERAREHIEAQDKLIASSMSLPQLVRYNFVAFLALAAMYPEMAGPEQRQVSKRLRREIRQMRAWADNCPENFQHLQFVMEAELARVSGRMEKALPLYAGAIDAAKKNEFLRDEAMANELAGNYFLQLEQPRAAEGYLRAAHYGYYRWGARRKVEHLESLHPFLQTYSAAYRNGTNATGIIHDNREPHSVEQTSLDLASVMKAARAISGEIVLEQLWKMILQILLENAGGQRGFFVMKKNDQLFVEAAGEVEGEQVSLSNAILIDPADEDPILPTSIINYALRTHSPLVLDDATQAERFAKDPYIIRTQPKSVICIPVIRPGQFEGAIYLENNLIEGTFVEDRVEIIELLSAQAAISIENAQLYTGLEQKVQERTSALSEKSNALEQLSNQLAKYLSPQVYQSIFDKKQEVRLISERKNLTIFFSDIVGFTETADTLASEELTQLLNHYLTEMSEIALSYGATIDKFVGDAIVIFFGDPESRGEKEDALACVRMAIAMRDRMVKLREIWSQRGIGAMLQVRMGINTGFCTVGNFGSDSRMDYTIIGSSVNLASRLETAAEPGQILISNDTYALIDSEIECEQRGHVTVKGFADPIAVCQVINEYKAPKKYG